MTGGGRSSGGGSTGGDFDEPNADNCDITMDARLHSVQHPAITQVGEGDVLLVELRNAADKTSVVCVLSDTREVVGALTAPGVSALVKCITRGNEYIATVTRLQGSDCTVHVARSKEAAS